jgi:hypothetical protein
MLGGGGTQTKEKSNTTALDYIVWYFEGYLSSVP